MQTAVSILELVDLNARSAYFVPMRARWSRSSCVAVARFFGSGKLEPSSISEPLSETLRWSGRRTKPDLLNGPFSGHRNQTSEGSKTWQVSFAVMHSSLASVIQCSVSAEEFMKRRDFMGDSAAVSSRGHSGARRNLTKRPLIAVLTALTKRENSPLDAFLQGMKELGYVDGQTVDIAYSMAEGYLDRFPVLAAEVVELRPDVILAAVTPAAVATAALTKSIPIVCPLLADAINLGLIASESRPGGNVTGVSFRPEG